MSTKSGNLVITGVKDQPSLLTGLREFGSEYGMVKLANELGANRAHLYHQLSPDGNPTLESVLKLISVLGLELRVVRKKG